MNREKIEKLDCFDAIEALGKCFAKEAEALKYWHTKTDWECAGIVIEGMRERGYSMELVLDEEGYGGTFFKSPIDGLRWSNHTDGPTAILRAALLALEGER